MCWRRRWGCRQILLTSALAFSIVKYAGAAYLIYYGIRTLLTPDPDRGQSG